MQGKYALEYWGKNRYKRGMKRVPFIKMHGAGNDMVVIDTRQAAFDISQLEIERLAHRQYGIGCDQVLIISSHDTCDIEVRIFNADGSEVDMCGNGARCVAWLVMPEFKKPAISMKMGKRILHIEDGKQGIEIEMGLPSFDPKTIPLKAEHAEAVNLGKRFSKAMALSMGNPHLVVEVTPAELTQPTLLQLVDLVAQSSYFPEGVNIHLVAPPSKNTIQALVWERGVGITLACGSGACAVAVAMKTWVDLPSRVAVAQPGGLLKVRWEGGEAPVFLSGPVACTFKGEYLL